MALSTKNFRLFSASFFALLSTACSNDAEPNSTTQQPAVTIFTGGPIYTGVENAPTVEAVAVSEGNILAVGTREIIIDSAGPDPKIVDLAGAALYPGFTDAHAHLLGIGMRELTFNLEGTESIAALVEALSEAVKQADNPKSIIGVGWIETGWPEGRMPNRYDLDPVSDDIPVLLIRADGHALVANSAALIASNIDDATPDPAGGKIERDENGVATGILIDNAMTLVQALWDAPNEARKREAYSKAAEVYSSHGWTGLHNMSVAPENIAIIEEMSDQKDFAIRVYNSIDVAGLDALAEATPRTNKNNHVITRAIKLYIDGALGSRGAALTEPYSDRPENAGLLLMTPDEARPILERAISADIQVNTHAIGDRGNSLLLDWYEQTFARHPDKTDIRWRIEHAQILHTEDIPRFAELGVIASMQPSHAIGDMFFAKDRLGADRLEGAYAWRALIDAGAVVAGGSDAPVERGDPLIEFYAAVARKGLNGYSDEYWHPEQAVTRDEALKMLTLWPAYASFQENALGTIEPGKRADFTVFSKDIMTIAEDDILTAKPVMTVVSGEIIFQAKK
ncbi:amidohydrolase [Hyphococcus lacteus]|uniref:Amidohydrolase n=1 Tax=Hyphococcus lacteus TaxID=3143536 RepID=A0ABV3Z338_9PROT